MFDSFLGKISLTSLFALAFSSSAFANMLVTDLNELTISEFADREWTLQHQNSENMRVDCLKCDEDIIVNIQINNRNTFGNLGVEAANKAKTNCDPSRENPLQCDTIFGIDQGKIMGIHATLKILDGIYIASYILGDDKTLVKIRTKASTKETASDINQQVFETFKAEFVKP